MKIEELQVLARQILENTEENVFSLIKDGSLMLIQSPTDTELNATFYEPVICLILQGSKKVITSERELIFGKGELLLVSHGLPVVSKIMDACEESPYIALVMGVNLNIVRSLYEEFGESALEMESGKSVEVEKASEPLMDSLYRLLLATQNKIDSMVLFGQILREVHFRLLQARSGGMLRDLLRVDSAASSISKAISIIRNQFNETLSVPEIAKSVGMSTSSFHQHFKSVTESTPLQYQKDLRLLEARRLIKSEGASITETALKVGYESPNQFSREYTRKFSINPSADSKTH